MVVYGMHGLGDNIHTRALLKQWLPDHDIWLESPWPQVFHDMIPQGLKVACASSPLHAQADNIKRSQFSAPSMPRSRSAKRIWYRPEDVRELGSVVAAMCKAGAVDFEQADFRMPIPAAWRAQARALIDKRLSTKPLLIYRPLLERAEWSGCAARNPLHAAYEVLFNDIRDRFFVISIANLKPGIEWVVGKPIKPDMTLHAGELDFEALAALYAEAALVWTSPGFSVPLAQAVSTPVICVFGGYESSRSFSAGARFSPYLGIDPIHPCECFQHRHPCNKAIDISSAFKRIRKFADEATAGAASIAEYSTH
jgi:ADP-heptose:LPS heptosyltransferase